MTTTTTVAKNGGIVYPILSWQAAQKTGVDFAILCAVLEQETAGGHNVYGHDPGWFCGAGTVTQANYRTYKAGRAAHNAQGVGPMQLTWPPYQDQADAAGGCWKPAANIATGADILAQLLHDHGNWRDALTAYNGSTTYADEVLAKAAAWRARLAGATPPGGGHVTSRWGTRWGPQDYYGTGMKVSGGMAQALERIRVLAGETDAITMYQGSWHKGTGQSAQTHWGADVVDISPYNLAARAKAAAQVGLIMFHRPAIPGVWQEHVHCILRPSDAELKASLAQKGHINYQAAQQILDWDKRLDGLADHAAYTDGPWYECKPFVWHPHYEQAQHPAKPPIRMPLAYNVQQSAGGTIRDLQAFVKEHPAIKQAATDLAAVQAIWRRYFDYNH